MREAVKNPVVSIFWLIGLGLIVGGLFLLRNISARAEWPGVAAEVLASEVVSTPKGGGMTGEVRVRTESGETRTFTLPYSSSSTSLLEQALAVAPAGETILLPVNPEDEGDLRLPVGPLDYVGAFFLTSGGLLFIFIPVGVIALADRGDAFRFAGWTFVLCGVLFFGIGAVVAAERVHVLTSWPSVEAVIVDSQVRRRPGATFRGRTRVNYGIDLSVRYEVDGQSLQSLFRAEEYSSSRQAALLPLLEGPLAVGETVTVQYDPSSPRVATLKKGWSFTTFWLAILCALAGVVTSLLGFAVVRFIARGPSPTR